MGVCFFEAALFWRWVKFVANRKTTHFGLSQKDLDFHLVFRDKV